MALVDVPYRASSGFWVDTVLPLLHLQAGAVDPAELAMYAALMTSTNVHMVVSWASGPNTHGVCSSWLLAPSFEPGGSP
jgi:hypothetical protein